MLENVLEIKLSILKTLIRGLFVIAVLEAAGGILLSFNIMRFSFVTGLIYLFIALFGALVTLGIAEIIKLLIAIERNTRNASPTSAE